MDRCALDESLEDFAVREPGHRLLGLARDDEVGEREEQLRPHRRERTDESGANAARAYALGERELVSVGNDGRIDERHVRALRGADVLAVAHLPAGALEDRGDVSERQHGKPHAAALQPSQRARDHRIAEVADGAETAGDVLVDGAAALGNRVQQCDFHSLASAAAVSAFQ